MNEVIFVSRILVTFKLIDIIPEVKKVNNCYVGEYIGYSKILHQDIKLFWWLDKNFFDIYLFFDKQVNEKVKPFSRELEFIKNAIISVKENRILCIKKKIEHFDNIKLIDECIESLISKKTRKIYLEYL